MGIIANTAVKLLTQKNQHHGLELTMYIGSTPLDRAQLWPKLYAALDLIAKYTPQWIPRMQRMNNSINVRRIPGNRARLVENRLTILDPYLLANFPPAQIASSIVHEATHAMMRHYDIAYDPKAPAREERACRRSEVRLAKRLVAAGVEGAQAALERAQGALLMKDADVGVVVDWKEMRILQAVTEINEMPVPMWMKRLLAKRRGVLNTEQGEVAFGRVERKRL